MLQSHGKQICEYVRMRSGGFRLADGWKTSKARQTLAGWWAGVVDAGPALSQRLTKMNIHHWIIGTAYDVSAVIFSPVPAGSLGALLDLESKWLFRLLGSVPRSGVGLKIDPARSSAGCKTARVIYPARVSAKEADTALVDGE